VADLTTRSRGGPGGTTWDGTESRPICAGGTGRDPFPIEGVPPSHVPAEEIPAGQQWCWASREVRRSLRLTDEMNAAIDRRAAAQNVPWSAVARHLIAEGMKATEAADD